MTTPVVLSLPHLITLLLALLLTLGWLSPAVTEAQAQAQGRVGQLVVYIEVPATAADHTVLVPGTVTIRAANGDSGDPGGPGDADGVELAPLLTTLDALALAGRQARYVDQVLPVGVYRALHIDFNEITAFIGPAEVHPELPPAGLTIPLDLEIARDRSSLLILRWTPRSPGGGEAVHEPALSLVEETVPPLGSLAFVSNEGSGNLTVIDRFQGRVVDVIMTGGRPRGMAYSQRDQTLFVAESESGAIVAVDALSRMVIKRAPLRFGDEPSRLVLSADENVLYVLNYGAETLSLVTTWSLQEDTRFAVGERPRALALDRLKGLVYVSSELAGEVRVFDPLLGNEVATFRLDSAPGEVILNESTQQLYLASTMRRRLLVLDAAAGSVTSQLSLCAQAAGLAYNPVSRRLYAAIASCREIAIVHPEQALEIGAIKLPEEPGLMGFDANHRLLMVTLPAVGQLAICNTNSNRLVGLVDVGREPYAVFAP